MRRGFSLVEILVVTAIIAVLAAIMFSVMGSAKAKSYETVDIAQMKQIYVAITLYEEQHDNLDPVLLGQLGDLVSDNALFKSPADPVDKPYPPLGGYSARPFVGEDERSPFRISYVYLRQWPPYDTDETAWQSLRVKPQIGMLASSWHGRHTDWLSPDWGPNGDGPVLRICMDGSFFRFPKRAITNAINVWDMFYSR